MSIFEEVCRWTVASKLDLIVLPLQDYNDLRREVKAELSKRFSVEHLAGEFKINGVKIKPIRYV